MSTRLALAVIALLVCTDLSRGDASPDACSFWKNMAIRLSKDQTFGGGTIHMNCNNNGSSCNRIQCSASVAIVPILNMHKTLNFCFGLMSDFCHNPAAMKYHIDIPSFNISQAGDVSHNDTLTIPGLQYNTSVFEVSGEVITRVQMERKNSSFIEFGISSDLRLTVGKEPIFTRSVTIFPPSLIATPECQASTNSTTPGDFGDFGPNKNCGTPPTVPTPTPTVTPTVVPAGKNTCEIGLMKCGTHAYCQRIVPDSKSRNGLCYCDAGYIWNTGSCVVNGTRPPVTTAPVGPQTTQPKPVTQMKTTATPKKSTPISTKSPPTVSPAKSNDTSHAKTTQGKKGKTNTIIIASVAGGVLLLVAIVTSVICIGRRKRNSIYRDRMQLLTDDDDDDDVALVI